GGGARRATGRRGRVGPRPYLLGGGGDGREPARHRRGHGAPARRRRGIGVGGDDGLGDQPPVLRHQRLGAGRGGGTGRPGRGAAGGRRSLPPRGGGVWGG